MAIRLMRLDGDDSRGQYIEVYSGGQVVLTHDPYPLPTPPPDSASSAGQ